MDQKTRPVSSDEHARVDADEHLPFGHFAPNAWQRALISLAARSFLRRGEFRHLTTGIIMGSSGKPIDVHFRGCAYRLRGRNNLIELGLLLNPGYNATDIDFLLDGGKPGDVFVDIGSNIGLYALPMARRAGASGRVVAIDANPLMARRLAWNATASGLDNVAIFACAVADREGSGSLNIRKNDVAIVSVEEEAGGSVPIRTLASILDEAKVQHIHGLKIDIEGHEDKALAPFIASAAEQRLPKRIVIERPPGNADYPACASAFAARGYRLAGRSRNNSFYLRD
ncbi:MAG: FkbM family methyltransferase [Mesorhizobium sp.]|nr:FkbM family methyltransferase [Mesorhizobium sp.]